MTFTTDESDRPDELTTGQSSDRIIREVLERWQGRGITCSLRGTRLSVQPWAKLTTDDQQFIRDNRAALKELLASGFKPEPAAPAPRKPDILIPAPEPLPIVGPQRHQLTEADVLEVLSRSGDEDVAAYKNGSLPRAEAIARAVAWHEAHQQIGGTYDF